MRQNAILPTLLAAAIGAATWAPAAHAAPASFAPLRLSIKTEQATLGPKTTKNLTRRTGRAKVAFGHHQWCASVRELSGVVTATKKLTGAPQLAAGERVAAPARALQQTIFTAHARRTKSCGLAAPTVKVSRAVKPSVASIPGVGGGPARPVSAISGHGIQTDFVSNEVVIASADASAVAAFAGRWHGTIVEHRTGTIGGAVDTYLVRIDAARADTAGISADLRTLDPASRGSAKLSDQAGLDLVAVSADAAAHGMKISPNFLIGAKGVLNRSSGESSTGPSGWSSDGYSPWYNQTGGVIGTGEAWRSLKIAGADKNKVKLAVVDGGFTATASSDFSGTTGDWDDGQTNAMQCGGGTPCPFHGTNVASTAAGVVDNGLGVAGTGGQVASVQAVRVDGGTEFDSIDGIYEAFEAGAKVINISSGMEMDALISVFAVPYEDATQTAREHGALVVASAGNDGRDVDAEDCFIVCWEEEWIAPCENDAVVCVGGITADRRRAPKSNFGLEWTEDAATSDVDIFSPFTVWVGADGATNKVHQVNGTSFSSPFVAGIAAMMLAADPSLTPALLEQGLKDTATSSPDKEVSRIVNADAAVKWALNRHHIPPFAQIDPTIPGITSYGGFNSMKLSATSLTLGNPDPGCCDFAWSSDKDGPMGHGQSIEFVFPTAGPRQVTVKATDKTGASSTATIQIDAQNDKPAAHITKPLDQATLYRGQTYKANVDVSDMNEPAGPSCSHVVWEEITGNPNQVGTGCQPAIAFAKTGNYIVRATVTDEAGAISWDIVWIKVVDPPTHTAPLVTILSPDNASSLDPNTPVTLKGEAIDPDGAGPVTGTWSVKVGSTVTPIGAGNTIQWTPGSNVTFHCGGQTGSLIFSATDGDGTRSTSVDISVPYPVC